MVYPFAEEVVDGKKSDLGVISATTEIISGKVFYQRGAGDAASRELGEQVMSIALRIPA